MIRLFPLGYRDTFQSVAIWTVKYGAAATITNPIGESGRVMDIKLNANANTIITNGITAGNVRLLVKCRQSTFTIARPFAIAARVGGTNTNRSGYLLRPGTSNNLRLVRIAASGTETILGEVAFPNVPLEWYWLDLLLEGSNLFASAWFQGDTRPDGWMISAVDATYASGEMGVQMGNSSDNFQFDLFNTTHPYL